MGKIVEKLKIENFKSIKHLEINCGRINLFIGEPNTGKSNILETFGLLSFVGSKYNLKPFVRFETLDEIFYDRNLEESVKIEIDFSNRDVGILKIDYKDTRFLCKLTHIQATHNSKQASDYTIFNYDFSGAGTKSVYSQFSIFKFYRFKSMSKFTAPESDYLLPPHAENLFSVLLRSKELRRLINSILNEFGLKLAFNRVEKRIDVLKLYEDIIVIFPYTSISETIQRVIFYLAAIKSNKHSVIVFEEPEVHTFPFYTKYLAERIATDENNQYFISTHNPYLLNSIVEKAKDVKVFLTYMDNYKTKVKELSRKELEELLELDLDVFFNIDGFLKEISKT